MALPFGSGSGQQQAPSGKTMSEPPRGSRKRAGACTLSSGAAAALTPRLSYLTRAGKQVGDAHTARVPTVRGHAWCEGHHQAAISAGQWVYVSTESEAGEGPWGCGHWRPSLYFHKQVGGPALSFPSPESCRLIVKATTPAPVTVSQWQQSRTNLIPPFAPISWVPICPCGAAAMCQLPLRATGSSVTFPY